MIIQEKAFLRGALEAFVPGAFFPPPPPQPNKWQPKESGFQDDAENLKNDWLAVGNYLHDAVNDHDRDITESR